MKETNKPNNLILASYPLRESLGGKLAGIHYKIGELVNLFLSLFFFVSNRDNAGVKGKRERNILACLSAILGVSLISSFVQFQSIDTTFFLKFIIKCSLTLFFCYVMFSRNIMFSGKNIAFLMKFIVWLELLFLLLQYVFRFRIVNFSFSSSFSTFNVGSILIERFSGTASEPGYLVPILALPTYYFIANFKKYKFYAIASGAMLLLTFSSFAYVTIGLLVLYLIINNQSKRTGVVAFAFFALFSLLIAFLVFPSIQDIVSYYFNKAVRYFSFGNRAFGVVGEWSAADRNQHFQNALDLFANGDFFQKLFGYGTGGYSYLQAINNRGLLVEGVEEAYNLYLSTLTDRGIVGLTLLIALFYNMLRIPAKDNIDKALRFGLIIQMLHYFLVGNLWLYFFWQNLVMLVGYVKFKALCAAGPITRPGVGNRCAALMPGFFGSDVAQ